MERAGDAGENCASKGSRKFGRLINLAGYLLCVCLCEVLIYFAVSTRLAISVINGVLMTCVRSVIGQSACGALMILMI